MVETVTKRPENLDLGIEVNTLIGEFLGTTERKISEFHQISSNVSRRHFFLGLGKRIFFAKHLELLPD